MNNRDIQQQINARTLGHYRLILSLTRGSTGEVWLAEDTELCRQVAAKLLPPVAASNIEYLHAFIDNARDIASLTHPHILPILDFGKEPSGENVITYLIMPLTTEGSLQDRIHATQELLPTKVSLRYLRQAAQAIDYAHSRQVLHGDIQPANMLIQQESLLLADFGIARLLSINTQRGQPYTRAGTPDYMAPEQIQGKAEAASDRYSLAIIAYQLLTGHKPFTGRDSYEIFIKQIQEMPPSPRQLNPHIPLTVELTLLKGLAKQPETRPATCSTFIDELEYNWSIEAVVQSESLSPTLWSQHPTLNEPTQLTSPPVVPVPTYTEQLKANTYQNVAVMDLPTLPLPVPTDTQTPDLAIDLVDLPTLAVPTSNTAKTSYHTINSIDTPTITVPMAAKIPDPVRDVPKTPHSPERAQKFRRRKLLIGGVSAAFVAIAGGTGFAAYLRRNELFPSPHKRAAVPHPSKPLPGPHKLISGIPLLRLSGHTDAVYNVAWHPSGRYIATAGLDTHVMLWDVGSHLQQTTMQNMKQPLHTWKFKEQITADGMSWSADGRTLAVSTPEFNTVYLITDQQSKPILYSDKSQTNLSDQQPIYNFPAWSPVDNLLALSLNNRMDVELWRRGNPNGPIRTLQGPAQPPDVAGQSTEVEDLAWSHDGLFLAGKRNDFKIVVWEVKTGRILPTLTLPDRSNAMPSDMANNHVANLRRGAIAWSPYTRNQLVASNVDVATVWDALTNQLFLNLSTDDPSAIKTTTLLDGTEAAVQVNGLAWSPNGRYIAGTYEHNRQIYIWDTLNKTPKTTKEGFQIQDLLFGAKNGHEGVPVQDSAFAGETTTIIDLAWSPDGRYLATASNDTTVIIWKVDDYEDEM